MPLLTLPCAGLEWMVAGATRRWVGQVQDREREGRPARAAWLRCAGGARVTDDTAGRRLGQHAHLTGYLLAGRHVLCASQAHAWPGTGKDFPPFSLQHWPG